MSNVSFLRHAGWFGPEDCTSPLNIIGVGATGSHIALFAAKMGFHKFHIWDADIVEDHNLPNQVYDVKHIGMRKVDALADVLTRFNPAIEVITHDKFFTREDKDALDGPLVLTVDTMSARKEIYECFFMNWKVNKVFETRLGFDYGELNVIDNMDPIKCLDWHNTLVLDSEVPDGPCNLRICTTLVGMVSAYTVHMLCNLFACERHNQEWSYNKRSMFNLQPTLQYFSL